MSGETARSADEQRDAVSGRDTGRTSAGGDGYLLPGSRPVQPWLRLRAPTASLLGMALLLVRRSFSAVLPRCDAEMAGWGARASAIPDPELRRQALGSLRAKRFHADGGAVFAAMQPPGPQRDALICLIVAVQTISDYLDNLCDRSTSLDPTDFRALHEAMLDAVTADGEVHDYYRHRRERADGGYLADLVRTAQRALTALPGYGAAAPVVLDSVTRYCDLQVHKHARPDERAQRLVAWSAAPRAKLETELAWWEYAAATGSTLGVFALFAAALDPGLSPPAAEAIQAAYFPWICGLHILLDYLVDEEEDRREGDLNFIAQYPSRIEAYARLELFRYRADQASRGLPNAAFHRLVVHGLIGMYLSDPKMLTIPPDRAFGRRFTRRMGVVALLFHWTSRIYRRRGSAVSAIRWLPLLNGRRMR
ncbi:MAG: tetraprenyl-beta-curcumene synthase family protein [Actinomycetota bacterium]|nr:tetraprenyl-beta-curcumene synthase family protein [Actinomycetota bacterium]